jgi:hypothetical protein
VNTAKRFSRLRPRGDYTNSDAAPQNVNRLGYYVGVASQSNNAGPDITPPSGDLEFGLLYGLRITQIAAKLKESQHDRQTFIWQLRPVSK